MSFAGKTSVLLPLLLLGSATLAPGAIHSGEKIEVYGDFRLRLEQDWDSEREDGTMRDDRLRLRARARIGLDYRMNELLTFGFRIRTGSDDSQQSGHITMLNVATEDDTGDAHINPDKWFVRAERGSLWAWAGRDSLAFWKQNEMFWDDDATVAGVSGGWRRGGLELQASYVSLPVGMQEFAGTAITGQAVWSRDGDRFGFTGAFGALLTDGADEDDANDAAMLLDGNGFRDYSILVGSLQGRLSARGRPLKLGVDLIHNNEGYSRNDDDPFTVENRDETDGYVVSATWGSLDEPRDWRVGYAYARVETLAVHGSYAQDNWVRWGQGPQNRSSNLKGHELNGAWLVTEQINVVSRLFLVDAITSGEDGNRFRIDLNFKF